MKKYVFMLSIVSVFFLISCEKQKKGKPEILKGNFMWHWHLDSFLDSKKIDEIKNMKMKGIFLHFGNFTYYENRMQFDGFNYQSDTFKRIKKLNDMQTHLVFTFANDSRFPFVRHFYKDTARAVKFIIDEIDSCLHTCRMEGLSVSGIQLDMEGRLNFAKYKVLVDELEKRYGRDYLISVCIQVFWKNRKGFKELIDKADFIIPMFYDYQIGWTSSDLMRVTNLPWMERLAKVFSGLGKPFYAGIPSYSYSKIYDHRGKRVEMWAGLDVEEMSENPDFKLARSRANKTGDKKVYSGDNDYVFRALRDTKLKNYKLKKGSRVKINLLTHTAVEKYLDAIKQLHPDNLLGFALFRYGYAWEDLVVNPKGIKDALEIEKVKGSVPELKVLVDRNIFVNNKAGDIVEFNFKLRNIGDSNSFVSEYANKLQVFVENAQILDASRGGFDSIETNGKNIRFAERHLEKNECIYTGLIKVKISALPVKIYAFSSSLQLDNRKELMSNEVNMKISGKKVFIN
jgi:hypothetical protein